MTCLSRKGVTKAPPKISTVPEYLLVKRRWNLQRQPPPQRCTAAVSSLLRLSDTRHVSEGCWGGRGGVSLRHHLTATTLARSLVERRATGTRSAAAIGSSEGEPRASWTHRGAGLVDEHQSSSVNTGRGKWDVTTWKTTFIFEILMNKFTVRGHHGRTIIP